MSHALDSCGIIICQYRIRTSDRNVVSMCVPFFLEICISVKLRRIILNSENSIKRIFAQGIIGRYDYDINFMTGDSGMKAIYSENGHGKTNLLKLISYITSGEDDGLRRVFSIPFKGVEIYSSNGRIALYREGHKLCKVVVYNKKENVCLSYDMSVGDISSGPEQVVDDEILNKYKEISACIYRVAGNSVFLGTNRLNNIDSSAPFVSRIRRRPGIRSVNAEDLEEDSSGVIVDAALYELHNSLVRNAQRAAIMSRGRRGVYSQITESMLDKSKSTRRNIKSSQAKKEILEKIRDIDKIKELVDKYKLINFEEFNSINETIDKARRNDGQFRSLYYILMPYFDSLEDRINDLIPAAELIESFIDSINTLFSGKEIRFSIQRGFEIFSTNENILYSDISDRLIISPSMLSSGEKHLMYLLSKVIVSSTREDSLLIIDEPEISLGMQWQRLFVKYVQECLSDSNLQIIMATHSPLILNDYDDDDVTVSTDLLSSAKGL